MQDHMRLPAFNSQGELTTVGVAVKTLGEKIASKNFKNRGVMTLGQSFSPIYDCDNPAYLSSTDIRAIATLPSPAALYNINHG